MNSTMRKYYVITKKFHTLEHIIFSKAIAIKSRPTKLEQFILRKYPNESCQVHIIHCKKGGRQEERKEGWQGREREVISDSKDNNFHRTAIRMWVNKQN